MAAVPAWLRASLVHGNSMCTLRPPSLFPVAQMRPPWALMMERLMASPIPNPFGFVVTKCPKIFSSSAAFTPMPVSATSMITRPAWGWRVKIVITRGPSLSGADGFTGIHQDVQQHLLELHAVAADRWHCFHGHQPDLDTPDEHRGAQQAHGVLDQRFDVHLHRLQMFLAKQGAQPVDDKSGMTGFGLDVGQRLANLLDVRRLPAFQEAARRLRVRQDCTERLADLVRERAGQLAERSDAQHVRKVVPLPPGLRLGALLPRASEEQSAD